MDVAIGFRVIDLYKTRTGFIQDIEPRTKMIGVKWHNGKIQWINVGKRDIEFHLKGRG